MQTWRRLTHPFKGLPNQVVVHVEMGESAQDEKGHARYLCFKLHGQQLNNESSKEGVSECDDDVGHTKLCS